MTRDMTPSELRRHVRTMALEAVASGQSGTVARLNQVRALSIIDRGDNVVGTREYLWLEKHGLGGNIRAAGGDA